MASGVSSANDRFYFSPDLSRAEKLWRSVQTGDAYSLEKPYAASSGAVYDQKKGITKETWQIYYSSQSWDRSSWENFQKRTGCLISFDEANALNDEKIDFDEFSKIVGLDSRDGISSRDAFDKNFKADSEVDYSVVYSDRSKIVSTISAFNFEDRKHTKEEADEIAMKISAELMNGRIAIDRNEFSYINDLPELGGIPLGDFNSVDKLHEMDGVVTQAELTGAISNYILATYPKPIASTIPKKDENQTIFTAVDISEQDTTKKVKIKSTIDNIPPRDTKPFTQLPPNPSDYYGPIKGGGGGYVTQPQSQQK